MIFGVVFAFCVVVSLLCYAMAPGIELALAGMLSVLLVSAGLALRRFSLILIASVILATTYLAVALSETGAFKVWGGLGVGLLLFLLLETGYDATTCVRSKIGWNAYSRRGRYLATIAVVSTAAVFVIVTLGFNIREHIPAYMGSRLVIPALYCAVAGISALVILAVRSKKR